MSPRHREFAEFEEEPLRLVLQAFARAHDLAPSDVGPRSRVREPGRLAAELAALGLSVDLGRLRTLRAVAGAAVPLLERRPRAHH